MFYFVGLLVVAFIYIRYLGPLRLFSKGYKYVYVKENGSIRELDEAEKSYLTETFHPNDGNRPYIKYRYSELTPDGKIHGFIKRKRVPFYKDIIN